MATPAAPAPRFAMVDTVALVANTVLLVGDGLTSSDIKMQTGKAIMVVHVGAFISLLVGYVNAG